MRNEHFDFVRQYLIDHGAEFGHRKPGQLFRSRSSHIARVMMWLERLLVQGGAEHIEALRLAAAFHDVGYAVDPEHHAKESAAILSAYGAERGLASAMLERAVFYVSEHSNKGRWLPDPAAPPDLVFLMEADLLDEEGAMGLAVDLLTAGALGGGYAEAYERMCRYEPRRLAENPMATPLARRFWTDKQALIDSFLQAFAFDLGEKEKADEA